MKKFILKVVIYLLIIASVSIIPAYLIDPYNVFHWDEIRDNGVEPNKNYIKTKYIVNNPELFESYILGSSRVSSVHPEKISDEKVYNMTYSRAVPAENLETIKTLLNNNVKIKNVYIGVDSWSYTLDPQVHLGTGLNSSYSYLQDYGSFLAIYTNPWTVFSSLKTILGNNHTWGGFDTFYTAGWDIDYDAVSTYDFNNAKASMGGTYMLEKTLEDIREIKSFCDDNNIGLVVWVNPLYKITYEESLKKDFYKFLEGLAEITDYYNFSGLNDITLNSDNYVDSSHYRAEVGDMIINVVWNKEKYDKLFEQGFGWLVNQGNIEDLIEILKSQENYLEVS